jgi:hypothetical protein
MTSTILTDQQLELLLVQGQMLESIEKLLPKAEREALVRLQSQAADAYAAGMWEVPDGAEKYVVPAATHHPTVDETRHILGESYVGLSDEAAKQTIMSLMQSMGLVRVVSADPPESLRQR